MHCSFLFKPSRILWSGLQPKGFPVNAAMSLETGQTASPRVFLTGVTGFVGGSILSCLYERHPDAHVKALIRKEEDAQKLQSIYPNLTPVIGTFSSLSLITSTAADVDFVIHVSGDRTAAVCAMIDGLASTSSTSSLADGPPLPRLISITGPLSLIDRSLPPADVAKTNSCPWSDVTDAEKILSLPKDRMHAESDQAIIAQGISKGVGVMLVSPGQQFGRGKGLLKTESHAATYFALVQKRKRAFVVNDGSATWSWSSPGDMGDAVVFLLEQSILRGVEARDKVGVNRDGYYFVQTGDASLKERAEAISRRLGLGNVESLSVAAAAEINPFGPLMWGRGVTFRADRLKELGWTPKDLDWRVLMAEEGGQRA